MAEHNSSDGGLSVLSSTSAPEEWDAYVERHPDGTAYHRARAVSIGRGTFGLSLRFLTAMRDNAIVGVLPLVEQSSRLFGHYLVSVPFFTYGGILADDEAIALALASHAGDIGRTLRVNHVELRQRAALDGLHLPSRLDKVSLVLPLPASIEELGRQLGSKLRSQVRRAERENPEVLWGASELVPDFYRVFSRSMRDLGTPVYPREFFEEACRAFGDLMSVLVVRVGGQVQAAAMVVRHGASIEVPWAAAIPEAKRNAINMRLYWELLCFSVRAGAKTFDFGRSTIDSGTYRFKAQWGAKPMQLYWYYWLQEGRELPQLNHSNPKYALAASAWKKLPLWCANLLGPLVIRHLP